MGIDTINDDYGAFSPGTTKSTGANFADSTIGGAEMGIDMVE